MVDCQHKNYRHLVRWLGVVFLFLVLAACSRVPGGTALESQADAAYQQSADGLVVIEAEYNQGSVHKGKHRWQFRLERRC